MTSTHALEPLRAAITAVFPDLTHARLTLLTAGWDSVAVDADGRLIFKFPRNAAAERALVVEAALLAVVRSAVTMPVPELTLHPGPPLFSRHAKLPGEHLIARQYERLSIAARDWLAADMALFYGELHALEASTMRSAGAGPIKSWPEPDDMLRRVRPVLPPDLWSWTKRTVAAWADLPPDPHGTTYGFFDGHGWNMAFDHAAGRLNGIYDFADSGFGPLHQEFVYGDWISPDLTERTVTEYEALTARPLDRARIRLLGDVLRLAELAEYADDPEHAPTMLRALTEWAAR